jgi:hypothetical protein
MQTLERNEHYTDKGNYAVMTRTSVIKYAQLARIADHICRNTEDLAAASDRDCGDSYSIDGTMLGGTYELVPLRVQASFDF